MAPITAIFLSVTLSAQTHNNDHQGGGEVFQHLESTSVAFIKANQNVSVDELGAISTFQECYPHASFAPEEEGGYGFSTDLNNIIPCAEFSEDWAKDRNIKAIWIHINRPEIPIGWRNLPDGFADENFIRELRNYSMHGGKLYLSGLATQLLVAIGRQKEEYAPNIYYTQEEQQISQGYDTQLDYNSENHGAWAVNGRLNGVTHNGETAYGHAKHAIYGQPDPQYIGYYAALDPEGHESETMSDATYTDVPCVFNILGPKEGESLNVSDNNCMWDGSRLGDGTRLGFRRANNCQIPGSWGQTFNDYNTLSFGIVEFLPDSDTSLSDRGYAVEKFGNEEDGPWLGNTIANGMACFQYGNKDNNKYYDNLRNMTFNTINYLSGEQRTATPTGIDSVSETANAESVVEYFNLRGIRIEYPAKGNIYIAVTGSKSSIILFQ